MQPDRILDAILSLAGRLGAVSSPPVPTIRHARPADVPELCAFGRDVIPPHYAPLIGEDAAAGQVEAWWTPEHFAPAVDEGRVLVAEESGRVVGVAQWGAGAWEDRPVMWKLYVHPRYRRRGLGRRLIDALVADLPAEYDTLVTEHFAANEDAARFYEREGFRQLSTEPAPDDDPRRATVWRARPLRRADAAAGS